MIPIQECQFCQKETKYVPIKVSDTRHMRVHYCHDCSAEYVYWSNDGALSSIHLYTSINNKMYRWSVNEGLLWYVEEPGIPGVKPNKKVTLLKKLEDFPPINPQNVEEKIKLMLLFL